MFGKFLPLAMETLSSPNKSEIGESWDFLEPDDVVQVGHDVFKVLKSCKAVDRGSAFRAFDGPNLVLAYYKGCSSSEKGEFDDGLDITEYFLPIGTRSDEKFGILKDWNE